MNGNAVKALEKPAAVSLESSKQEENRGFPIGPVVVFIAGWLGGSWLVVGAWLHPFLPGGWGAVVVGLALGALPVWTLARGVRGAYPSAIIRLLILRPFWYAMLFMPLLAGATLLGAILGLPIGASGGLGRWALGVSATVFAIVAVAGYIGSRRLVVRNLEVRMPRLPSAFDGLRVVQISDLHVGPHTSRRFLRRIAERVQRERPELIAVTGDQVDDFAPDVEHFLAAFGDLDAPLGTFVVAGNHDVYAGWDAVRRGLTAAGLKVLVNQALPLERGGQRLWIAGTGDPAAGSSLAAGASDVAPDIERTLSGIPSTEPTLALAHNPALWPALAQRGVDLTLSGHTHYGQLAIPSRGWSIASPFVKLAMGSHRQGRSLLYINPGTNFWGIPFRIGTSPEVTVLTLKTSQDVSIGITEEASQSGSGGGSTWGADESKRDSSQRRTPQV